MLVYYNCAALGDRFLGKCIVVIVGLKLKAEAERLSLGFDCTGKKLTIHQSVDYLLETALCHFNHFSF